MDELLRVTMLQGLFMAFIVSLAFVLYYGDCLVDDWKAGRSVFRKHR